MVEQALACRRPYRVGWSAWHLPSQAVTLLARAPQDAVRRWVYQPTLLGAESVELITSIYIVFRPIPD